MCGLRKSKHHGRALRGEELGAEGVERDIVFETVEEAMVRKRQSGARRNKS